MKGLQCKAFLWLFVVSISQNVFFDSFANEEKDRRARGGRARAPTPPSHEKQTDALLNCFIFVEVCF